jgi:glucose-6-phosphate 1-epimerase
MASFAPHPVTGRNAVTIQAPDGSTVTIYEQGAHVSSWTANGKEVLYLSPQTAYQDGKAIRGGIPICWPQFSDMGHFPAHGFARTRKWKLVEARGGDATLLLEVKPDDAVVPGAHVRLTYRVSCSNTKLTVELTADNLGTDAFQFTTALHTYFAVNEIADVQVQGLDKASFADNLKKREVFDPSPVGPIACEVDRIYFGVANPVVVQDRTHAVTVKGNHMPDVVLWNPWIEKAKKMADLPDEDFHKFVCVEHGVIREPVLLQPGSSWHGGQEIVVKGSSNL